MRSIDAWVSKRFQFPDYDLALEYLAEQPSEDELRAIVREHWLHRSPAEAADSLFSEAATAACHGRMHASHEDTFDSFHKGIWAGKKLRRKAPRERRARKNSVWAQLTADNGGQED